MDNVVTFYSKKPQPVSVNGEVIADDEIEAAAAQFSEARDPRQAAARALAVRALLRQRAQALRIEAADEEAAIEQLLLREVPPATVGDDEVRRYYEGHPEKFSNGDLFQARHILFDTHGGGDGKELIRQAEAVLLQLKEHPEWFEKLAREKSACTSREVGGELGQLSPGSVVPEFWGALVEFGATGLLPHLVESRYGHHIVMIDHCVRGKTLPFEVVEARLREFLTARREQLAFQSYVAGLIGQSNIQGVEFGDTAPPPAGQGLPSE